jgi:hypothetical protein
VRKPGAHGRLARSFLIEINALARQKASIAASTNRLERL